MIRILTIRDYDFKFSGYTDEEVVSFFRAGNEDALDYLLVKYKNFVRAKAKPYFIVGASKEDIIQEGLIGLFKAVRDFNEDKRSSFISFAEMCIVRQIITAVKSATRLKHTPLNFYISLDKPVTDDESERTMWEVVARMKQSSPEEILIHREQSHAIHEKANSILSNLEKQVLVLYIQGRSYQEISQLINKPTKTIDNALQRIKKKSKYKSKIIMQIYSLIPR